MSKVDQLVRKYEEFARLPWDAGIAGPQRVWFAVYQPTDERRLRCRLDEFALATQRAGHKWASHDLTDAFAQWMSAEEYRESYFESPDDLEFALEDFRRQVADEVIAVLDGADDETVVALCGVGSLFGFMRVAQLVERVAPHIKGRLLVFFPGEHEGTGYRIFDTGDGWNYLAVPITV